jgi:hypothetical protein
MSFFLQGKPAEMLSSAGPDIKVEPQEIDPHTEDLSKEAVEGENVIETVRCYFKKLVKDESQVRMGFTYSAPGTSTLGVVDKSEEKQEECFHIYVDEKIPHELYHKNPIECFEAYGLSDWSGQLSDLTERVDPTPVCIVFESTIGGASPSFTTPLLLLSCFSSLFSSSFPF